MNKSLELVVGNSVTTAAVPAEIPVVEKVEADWDAPVEITSLMQARRILADMIVAAKGQYEPLVIEPTDEVGIYSAPNGGPLLSHYVRMADYNAAHGIATTPIDGC